MNPDFLGIGAQKGGTTWLYWALVPHPDVWFPPIKEFHYWDLPTALPTAALTAHRERFRTQLRKMGRAARDGRRDDLVWLARYLFLPRSDGWYGSLFDPPPGKITGDITPAYARLDARTVAGIAARMPDVRIVYSLRNPVDRIWSQARMDLGRRGRLEGMSDEALIRWLESPHPTLATDYARTLRIWERHFPEDRIHVMFLDAIGADPERVLRDLQDFLGVEQGHFPRDLGEAKNTSAPSEMPPAVARHLARRWLPLCRWLDERFANEHTARWVEDTRELLER